MPGTVIRGGITPKSVVASGTGVVFAQNMIYSHTITVYDAAGKLLKTIPDAVDLAAFGITGHPAGAVKGGPVEMAFSPDGKDAYVSNYSMYGPGFTHPGHDACSPASGYDSSFVYRVNVAKLTIDKVIPVGSVPKYVATTPDGRYVLVTNWCSYDLSVIDVAAGREVKRLPIGPHPRGIAVDSSSRTAYIAVMGGRDIVTVDLATFAVGRIADVGGSPRHLVLSPDDKTLYATLNADGQVAKIDLASGRVSAKVNTGSAPRSMAISADGLSLYVVNYESSTVSKVDAGTMRVMQSLPTSHHPIGITYDASTGRIWVACYSGTLELFNEA
ncbi:MAG: YncE family protein [Actinomycetota bacterium]|nr:YncE family protein [Actinomycetota bacterium]